MGHRGSNWRAFREDEFKGFITELCKFARRFNFSVWVGGTNRQFSVVISAYWKEKAVFRERPFSGIGFGIRLDPNKGYQYSYAENAYCSPSALPLARFDRVIGATTDEALEFAVSRMKALVEQHGIPTRKAYYHTMRLDKISEKNRYNLVADIMKQIDWDQGRYGTL